MSGSMPFDRESRAHARAAADSLSVLPAGDKEAALPASMRNCVRSAGVVGTAMFADLQSPTNVVGGIEADSEECRRKVVQVTGAEARIRGREKKSGGNGRSRRTRRQHRRRRFDSRGMLGSFVGKCLRQRSVNRIFCLGFGFGMSRDFTCLTILPQPALQPQRGLALGGQVGA